MQKLQEQNTQLLALNKELSTVLQQADVIDKLQVMHNFVLLSIEIERLSKAFVQQQQQHHIQTKTLEDVYIRKIDTLIKANDHLNQLILQEQNKSVPHAEIHEANKRIQILIQINEQLQNNEDGLMRQIDQLKSQLQESDKELTQAIETMGECESSYKENLSKQSNVIIKMNKELKDQMNELDRKDQSIQQLVAINQQLVKDIENQNNQLAEQENHIQNLMQTIKNNQKEFEAYKIRNQSSISEVQSLNQRLEQKNSVIINYELKIDQLTQEMRQAKRQVEEKQSALKFIHDQHEFVKDQLEVAKGQMNILSEQLKQEKETSNSHLINLQKQIKLNEENTQNLNDQNQQLTVKIYNKDLQIEKLTQQYQLMKSDSQQMKQVVLDLNNVLNTQKEMLQSSQIEQAQLKQSIIHKHDDHLDFQLMKAKDMIHSLENQVDKLTDELNYYKQQMKIQNSQVNELRYTKNYLSQMLMDRRY